MDGCCSETVALCVASGHKFPLLLAALFPGGCSLQDTLQSDPVVLSTSHLKEEHCSTDSGFQVSAK